MRLLFLNILFSSLVVSGLCQTKTLALYQTALNKSDTTFYLTIQRKDKGISFVFPVEEDHPYYTVRSDSTLEEHPIPGYQPIYGPYKFKKVAGKILFQDKSISNKYRDLYDLSDTEHLSPDLFSSGTDSYSILNRLLDSNALLNIGNKKVKCYKFTQALSGHIPGLYKYCRILYIDKINLLPCRIEYYADKDCKILETVIFMKDYTF